MNRIYISIAGYRDPLIKKTIEQAYTKAQLKNRLVFGIVDQSYEKEFFIPELMEFRNQIRYLRIDPQYARGACWARNLGQSLYAGEEYFFQCDSHTLFDQDWDTTFEHTLQILGVWHNRPIITCYPRAFLAENNDINNLVLKPIDGCFTLVADPEHAFKGDKDMYVGAKAKIITSSEPVHGYMLSANCLFTQGRFCEEVPYDPYLYFSGEEHSLAVRAWTNGYNIFHMPVAPVYHHYGRDYRTTVWGDKILEETRNEKWWQIDQRSKQRLGSVCRGEIRGAYGLGTERSLHEYIQYCGIDYFARTINDIAKTGDGIFDRDWRQPVRI
jgi:Glycosyltransferase (GlcNAc)